MEPIFSYQCIIYYGWYIGIVMMYPIKILEIRVKNCHLRITINKHITDLSTMMKVN